MAIGPAESIILTQTKHKR